MNNLNWPELRYVATSSPKKKRKAVRKPKLSRSFEIKEDENHKDNNNGINLELENIDIEYSDDEIFNSSTSLSPIRSYGNGNKTERGDNENGDQYNESQKVTSFENAKEDSNNNNDNRSSIKSKESFVDISDEEVQNESINSVKSEAETTIQKVKEFIETKRKILNGNISKNPKLDTKLKLNHTIPKKIVKSIHPKHQLKEGVKGANMVKSNSDVARHRRILRRLIHEIHKFPYESVWKAEEWRLFQEYLNEWKLSKDDEMFQPIVLEDLFNCKISEIEIRINGLKKFVHWKKNNLK